MVRPMPRQSTRSARGVRDWADAIADESVPVVGQPVVREPQGWFCTVGPSTKSPCFRVSQWLDGRCPGTRSETLSTWEVTGSVRPPFVSLRLLSAVQGRARVIRADARVRGRACEELLAEDMTYTPPPADIAQR